jgi:hypothetical protein
MEHDEIRKALLRRGQPKCPSSLIEWIVSIFRKPLEPPPLLQSCVRVGNEIVAKACIYLGREFRIAPDAPLPSDYHLIVAYCFMVGALISASIEEEGAVDDIALQYWISRHLLIRRARDEQLRMVKHAWAVAQDVMGLREDDAHNWQTMLTLGVDGYITGHDITAAVVGGYPELFGNLLADLIATRREPG